MPHHDIYISKNDREEGREGVGVGLACGPTLPLPKHPGELQETNELQGRPCLLFSQNCRRWTCCPPCYLSLPGKEQPGTTVNGVVVEGGREMQVVTQALCLGCCDVRVMGTWVNPTKRQKHGRKQRQCFRAQKWKLILSKVGQGGTSFFLNGVSKSSRTQRITIRCWFHPLTFNL